MSKRIPKTEKSVPSSISLPPKLRAASEHHAESVGLNLSALVRTLLIKLLNEAGRENLGLADASKHNGKKKIVDSVNHLKGTKKKEK